mmetsp:Transcript_27804/g.45858  ORF Transcript_27804/g.45858 Transcript_27804/m.45858 type:complete len:244 (+) Transcript_27804:987-1718(+)
MVWLVLVVQFQCVCGVLQHTLQLSSFIWRIEAQNAIQIHQNLVNLVYIGTRHQFYHWIMRLLCIWHRLRREHFGHFESRIDCGCCPLYNDIDHHRNLSLTFLEHQDFYQSFAAVQISDKSDTHSHQESASEIYVWLLQVFCVPAGDGHNMGRCCSRKRCRSPHYIYAILVGQCHCVYSAQCVLSSNAQTRRQQNGHSQQTKCDQDSDDYDFVLYHRRIWFALCARRMYCVHYVLDWLHTMKND